MLRAYAQTTASAPDTVDEAVTIEPAFVLAGLGIESVAIGFAFKDMLQNWLAGLLILIQRPFRVGDQIVGGYESTVE